MTSPIIADGSVTAADLADGAVDSSVLLDGSVSADDLADQSVDTDALVDGHHLDGGCCR